MSDKIDKMREDHDALFAQLEQLAELHPEAADDAVSTLSEAVTKVSQLVRSAGLPPYEDLISPIGPADEGAAGFVPLPAAPVGGSLPEAPTSPPSAEPPELYESSTQDIPLPQSPVTPVAYPATTLEDIPAPEPPESPVTPSRLPRVESGTPAPMAEPEDDELPDPPTAPKPQRVEPVIKTDLSDAVFADTADTQGHSVAAGVGDLPASMRAYQMQLMEMLRQLTGMMTEFRHQMEEIQTQFPTGA